MSALINGPLSTPFYKALWNSFSDPRLVIVELDEEPPLDMSPSARREFERHFLSAYFDALASPLGQMVSAHVESIERLRCRVMREVLVQDIASWGERHVFGNRARNDWPEGDPIPFMPLGVMYVEPQAKLITGNSGEDREPLKEPITTLIERFVASADCRIVVVKADFGSGKSLSGRTVAQRWAEKWLTEPTCGDELVMPVFIRCVEDFSTDTIDLSEVVRSAWKRQTDGLGLSLAASDPAFALPEPSQRTVFILDGLDEISFGEQRLSILFKRLHDAATDRHKFVVFSRPGVIPPVDKLRQVDAHIIELLPLDGKSENGTVGGQVGEWLSRWNTLVGRDEPITPEQVAARGLLEIARTPILLFMIAEGWDRHARTDQGTSLAEIYEGFFQHIAHGKHKADRDENPTVHEAARLLLEELQKRRTLGSDATPPDAMLWLMARIAWEAHKLARKMPPETLSRWYVNRIVEDSTDGLGIQGEFAGTIEIGLLLTLQADLRSGSHQILFGHQSFREFLVARYWSDRLLRIVQSRERDWSMQERHLLGARLLGHGDKSLSFLVQMINDSNPDDTSSSSPFNWTDRFRGKLVEWAQATFEDERPSFPSEYTSIGDDLRPALREAALAIGSLTKNSNGIHCSHPGALKSLLAWFWLRNDNPVILAPRLSAAGADLNKLVLSNADFRHSDFASAAGTVDLDHVDFRSSNLSDIEFDGSLYSCRFDEATLKHANFENVMAAGSSFRGADLRNVGFWEAYLHHADFQGAQLSGANFARAKLQGANFDGVDLSDVVFVMHAADPHSKDRGPRVYAAEYDDKTIWPPGFDPKKAGLRSASDGDPDDD
jgi:uncharacterized protein YjbI with pentapeptide repeats